MSVAEAFGNIADILARMDPSAIVQLKAPESMSERVEELVARKKEDRISKDEMVELERYLSLDLLINLAKARAKRILSA